MRPSSYPGRARRALGWALRRSCELLGVGLLFTTTAAGSLILHLDRPAARRTVAAAVTRGLDGIFQGKLMIDQIDQLTLLRGEIRGARARVLDPDGRTIIAADGVTGHFMVGDFLRSLVGSGPMMIRVQQLRVAQADVLITEDWTGMPSIARAFLSPTSDAGPDPTADPSSVMVQLEGMTIEHVWAHGGLAAFPVIDADLDQVQGDLHLDETGVRLSFEPMAVRARGLPLGPLPKEATVKLKGALWVPTGGELGASVEVAEARMGDVTVQAEARWDHGELNAQVTMPRTPPEALRRVLPALPLYDATALSATVYGVIPELHAKARADVGDGHVDIEADLKLGEQVEIDAQVRAEGVAPRSFAPEAPAGWVTASVRSHLWVGGFEPTGSFDVKVEPTTLAGQPTPAVQVAGELHGEVLSGRLQAQEAGLDATGSFLMGEARAEGRPLTVALEARSDELRRNARLQGQLGGRARVEAKARLMLGERSTVDGEATVQASGLGASGVRVGSATVQASAHGPLTTPVLSVQARASAVQAGNFRVEQASARLHGTLASAQASVSASGVEGAQIEASAGLSLSGGVAVRGGKATIVRNSEKVEATVASVTAQGAAVQVKGLALRGDLGQVDIDLLKAGNSLETRATVRELDLPRLARLAGIDPTPYKGRVDLDADVKIRGEDAQGKLALRASKLGVGDVQGVDAEVNASLDQRLAQGRVAVTWKDGGHLRASVGQARLAGPALSPASWQHASFEASADGDVTLDRVLAEIPLEKRPVRSVGGQLQIALKADRAADQRLPAVHLTARTRDLEVELQPANPLFRAEALPPRQAATGPRPVRDVESPDDRWLRGTDVEASLDLEADRKLRVNAAVSDAQGKLAGVELRTTLTDALLRTTEVKALLDTPFEARASVPRRKVHDWPRLLRPKGLLGEVAVEAAVQGTARAPQAQVWVDGYQVEMPAGALFRAPVDVRARASYGGSAYRAGVDVLAQGATLAAVRASGEAHHEDLLDARPGGPRWDGDVQAAFANLPLQSLAALAGTPLVGCLQGSLKVEGLHRDVRVASDLSVTGLRVGDTPVDEARLLASFDGAVASVSARLRTGEGHASFEARSGMQWGARLVPEVKEGQGEALSLRLQASSLRLKALQPLLSSQVSTLDGFLDADLRITPALQNLASSRADGFVQLRAGHVNPRALGQDLQDIQARLEVTPEGAVRLRDTSLRSLSGKASVQAEAQLRELHLVEAHGSVDIKEDQAFPIANDGTTVGDLWGHIDLSAAPQGEQIVVRADVKRLDFELPRASPRSVQKLDPEPTLRLGYTTERGTFRRVLLSEQQQQKRNEVVVAQRAEAVERRQRSSGSAATTPADPGKAGESSAVPTMEPPDMAIDGTPEQQAEARRRAREERLRRQRQARGSGMPVSPVLIDVQLPRDKVRIHRTDQIDLFPRGGLKIAVGGRTTAIEGLIEVDRGRVDIQGRRFFVERASASFDPSDEPSNPTVNAVARFDASDATRVYAEYVGTVSTGQLRLRSDPALSQGEILSLILFGTREGLATQNSGGAANNTSRAASLGGGFLTQGLNEALSDLSLGEVTTRIDTSNSANPKPEVSVALSQDISASISYRLGVPTPGQNPDTSTLKLEYRFRPRWSVETSLGDRGTSIFDLFWRYRY